VKLWRKTASYIDSRPLRERWLILGTAFAVLVLVIDLLALQPLLDDRTQLGRDMRTVEADIRTQNEEIARLQLELAKNPNEAPRRELAQLEQEMALLERRIAEVTRRLVAPDQMASVLQAVLSRAGRLQLISLENLEPQPLEITHPDRDEPEAEAYRHGMRIVMQGSFNDALDYLQELEALPWSFFWDRLEIDAGEYPNNRVTIEVYTISVGEEWLGV
jgi:MSHA biogenesis protein MshJ